MSRRQRRANRTALLIGLTATALVVLLGTVGALDWLELKTLDLRFVYANSMPASPAITCVDIDDGSLARIGRWPWPRDVQAGLIAVLNELGARAIMYDITLTEPEPVRTIVPEQADLALDPMKPAADAILAFPDTELEATLADAHAVYLSFHYQEHVAKRASATIRHDHVGRRPDADLRHRIQTWLDAEPGRWSQPAHALFEQLCAAWGQPETGSSCEQIGMALRDVLGYAATVGNGVAPPSQVCAPPVDEIVPVYFPLARAARRCGFVVFEPDGDGRMRHVNLFVQHDGLVLAQLACGVALDVLHWKPSGTITYWGTHWQLFDDGGRRLRVQIDSQGRVLVPWLPAGNWTRQFGPQIPMAAIWQVYDRRLAVLQNLELVCTQLGNLLDAGRLPTQRQYHADLKRRLELESELRLARYRGDASSVADVAGWITQYRQALAEAEPGLRTDLARAITAAATMPAADAGAAERLAALRETERALAANEAYARDIDDTLARLRPSIADRICLVGYTATAEADMTPIPTSKRAPGLIAHANLLNGLLLDRMPSWAPAWLNALLAAGVGMLATLLSSRWPPRAAAALISLLLLAYVLLVAVVPFYVSSCWVALVPAVVAAVVSYIAVLLYRYVFIERESRQVAMALSQYTSATLAREMAEDPALCRRAEKREVTAMFTDLRGFTPISERIGAERTQHVLNLCLGRCAEVMLRYEAMINKFIGDGIFAFWNPLIFPQPDHALRACETALDLQVALRELADEQRRAGGDEVFGELVLRVGVATGTAVVGPCGSEQKYDYTCIGDTVNLAARLESANKFYGTLILAGGATHEQVGARFVFRPLGGVQVKGKRQAVPIYELLGRAGETSEPQRAYAEEFGRAIDLFHRRQWDQARAMFDACRSQRSDDLAAQRYLEALALFATQPPADDWGGALELSEK